MKKWIRRIAVLTCMAAAVVAVTGCCIYSQMMDDVQIAQYFVASADNLDWQTVRMRAIVPADRYHEGWTEDAMRIYAIIRSRNIPDRIDIVIYDSMEKFELCEEYAKTSFEK